MRQRLKESQWPKDEQHEHMFPESLDLPPDQNLEQQGEPCSSQSHHPPPYLFLKPHLVPFTFTSLGGSTKVQAWFLSKFSNSSCMTLTQLESKSVCPTSQGSNKATKSVLVKQEKCAYLEDRVTLSFRLPMIC
jgi:hypothetical protein